MELTFAGVVDEIRQLSTDEKKELVEIIERDLIEERREEILGNCEEGLKEFKEGKLKFYTDVDELMAALNG